ncbi:exosortase-dependent surface protein XDP1 [Methyloversatilis thermotolerans]|uniref:exosortase-dependent surface protein XDP1 n=1 Tax=Methyloversatilis thermotolerans TaxID=1346290 RepID=UPI0003A622B0|nr:exosortase-dependent surface protein XDP1 [Methyloversatilis thermotolerans]
MSFNRSFPVAIALAALALPAGAASYTFTGSTNTSLGGTTTYSGVASSSGEVVPSVTVSAWASASSSTSSDIQAAYLEQSGGDLRVRAQGETTSSPDHAMDNSGKFEAILFDFGAGNQISLDSINLGWWSNDSDVAILAYTGGVSGYDPAALFSSGPSTSFASLESNGWSMIGEYTNIGTSTTSVNSTDVASRYWLIGAAGLTGSSLSGLADYVKLSAITTTNRTPPPPPPSTGVPEPASLALIGGAFAAMVAVRRRKAA